MPANMPIPFLLADTSDLERCVKESPDAAFDLADKFWPGALTLVLKKSAAIPDIISSGGDTVAVRVPNHSVPRPLVNGLGAPITGTSANCTGEPAFTSYHSLNLRMGSELDYIVNGGDLPLRPASTVVDLTGDLPRILRQGGVSKKDVETTLGVEIHPGIV